ncbi:MAG: GNAT family N-acetyltransferase [Alphaproteobacteria bacterium]|nr:GNAT family N-acetyltransferase [Alphaproteobacteria bacterium]
MLELAEKLTGERIYLQRHPKTIAHAEKIMALVKASLPEISPWLGWATDKYAVEDMYEYLVFADSLWQRGEGYIYGIYLQDNTLIGNISIQNVDYKNRKAEIGYWMATQYAGNGYMQEAVKTLEKVVFAAGMHRLTIRADVLNGKSCNVALKCGYQFEGTLHGQLYAAAEDRYRDMNIFAKVAGK